MWLPARREVLAVCRRQLSSSDYDALPSVVRALKRFANCCSRRGEILKELEDALDRDAGPSGPVVELVAQLVHGFVEQVGIEQAL
jgi:hypothetical protein